MSEPVTAARLSPQYDLTTYSRYIGEEYQKLSGKAPPEITSRLGGGDVIITRIPLNGFLYETRTALYGEPREMTPAELDDAMRVNAKRKANAVWFRHQEDARHA